MVKSQRLFMLEFDITKVEGESVRLNKKGVLWQDVNDIVESLNSSHFDTIIKSSKEIKIKTHSDFFTNWQYRIKVKRGL